MKPLNRETKVKSLFGPPADIDPGTNMGGRGEDVNSMMGCDE